MNLELNEQFKEYRQTFLEEALGPLDQACYELYLQRIGKIRDSLEDQMDEKMLDTLSLSNFIYSHNIASGDGDDFLTGGNLAEALSLCPANIHAWNELAQRGALEGVALSILHSLGYVPMIRRALENKVQLIEHTRPAGQACKEAKETLRQITRLASSPDQNREPDNTFEKEFYARATDKLLKQARKIQGVFSEITPFSETYKLWRKRGARFEEGRDLRQALVDYLNLYTLQDKLEKKDSELVYILDRLLDAGQNQAALELSDLLQTKIETAADLQNFYNAQLDEKAQALQKSKTAFEALPDTPVSGGNILLAVCAILVLVLCYVCCTHG